MFKIIYWFLLGIYTTITLIPRYLILGIICIINPKKGSEVKIKGKPIIPLIMLSLSLTTYFICIFIGSKWYVQKLKINYLTEDILKSTQILEQEQDEIIDTNEYTPIDNNKYQNIDFMSVDFNNLLKQLFHFLKAFNLIGRPIFYFAAVTVKKAGVYP